MNVHTSFYGLSACMSYRGDWKEGQHIIHWAAFIRSAVVVFLRLLFLPFVVVVVAVPIHILKTQHNSTVCCCCYCSCALAFIKCTLSASGVGDGVWGCRGGVVGGKGRTLLMNALKHTLHLDKSLMDVPFI